MKHLFLLLTLFLCIPFSGFGQHHSDWSYNLGMYEVNVRQFSQQGTFSAFQSDLDRIEDLGVGVLWFMPIYPIGQENRLGSLGSYYSVQNYLDVNPNFGTLDDFKSLVEDVQSRDMYVVIDWVANHTSWDNVLTETNPEWYVKNNNGEFIPPPGTNWSDVIELDFTKQGLRDYMIDALKFWVDSVGVDGFRFDAVSFVPDDFWEEALPELKSIKPDIFLLAEGNEAKYTSMGFHANYAWEYYGFEGGILTRLADGSNTANNLRTFANTEKSTYSNGDYRLYFTSNHDENSWSGTTFELFGSAATSFNVLTHVFNGMPLIYNGQEAGLNKRLAFFEKDLIPWRNHPNTELFNTLLELKKENKALWNGFDENELERVLTSNNPAIFAFVREMEGDKVFAVFNMTANELTFELRENLFSGNYKDTFTDELVSFNTGDSLTLSGWGYKVYDNTGISTNNEETEDLEGFNLQQNYPNPFNPATNITYSLPQATEIKLTVYDLLGREIRVLESGYNAAGTYTVSFDGSSLSSGIYFYRLETSNFYQTKQFSLIK